MSQSTPTLQLSRGSHWLLCHLRAFLFAMGEFSRHPLSSLFTILVIGIATSLPLMLFILQTNAKTLSQGWNTTPSFSLYLKKTATESDISTLLDSLKKNHAISHVDYVSPEQGLKEFSKVIQIDNFDSKLGDNPLPPVLIITPNTTLGALALSTLNNNLQNLPQVDMVQWDKSWIERFYLILTLVKRFTYFLSVLLCGAVLLIIGNTIRLTTQTHRREIILFKLMGASAAFIRRPLLYRGFLYGLFGGLLAWLLVILFFWNIGPTVQMLLKTYQSAYIFQGLDLKTSLMAILTCSCLGFLGAWLAAERYLLSPKENH